MCVIVGMKRSGPEPVTMRLRVYIVRLCDLSLDFDIDEIAIEAVM